MDIPPPSVGRSARSLRGGEEDARLIRSELASLHWYPVYAFLRAAGFDADAAGARAESALARFIGEAPPRERAGLLREAFLVLARETVAEQMLRGPLLTIAREWAVARFAEERRARRRRPLRAGGHSG